MKRTRIKVCGVRTFEDAMLVCDAGCDAIGFNFYEKSPRFVAIQEAAQITRKLPAFVNKTALFVNAGEAFVNEVIENVAIDTLQFHGDESPAFCEQFGMPFVKAISVSVQSTMDELENALSQYEQAASILLDTEDKVLRGGSGVSFDWDVIPVSARKQIILAGGLNAENVVEAIRKINPYAVDVSSGVEKPDEDGELQKGVKDKLRIEDFVRAVQLADDKI